MRRYPGHVLVYLTLPTRCIQPRYPFCPGSSSGDATVQGLALVLSMAMVILAAAARGGGPRRRPAAAAARSGGPRRRPTTATRGGGPQQLPAAGPRGDGSLRQLDHCRSLRRLPAATAHCDSSSTSESFIT